MPQRIQRQRTNGWRMPEGAVYVGRPTRWANPFVVGSRTIICVDGADGLMWDGFEITLTPENVVEAFRDVMTSRLRPTTSEHPDDRAFVREWQQAASRHFAAEISSAGAVWISPAMPMCCSSTPTTGRTDECERGTAVAD